MAKKQKAKAAAATKSQSTDGCQKYSFKGKVCCDNHADIYIGTKNHLTELIGSQDFPDITDFSGEVKCCDYIYFVCWSDDIGLNGLIAVLSGGNLVRTGDTNGWEVFATGIDKDDMLNRPSTSQINNQIVIANQSTKWKAPFVGSSDIGEGKPWKETKLNNTPPSNFIWHNSEKDSNNIWPTSPYVPFDVI